MNKKIRRVQSAAPNTTARTGDNKFRKFVNGVRRTVAAVTLGLAVLGGSAALTATLAGCPNPSGPETREPTAHERLVEQLKAEYPGKSAQWYEDVAAKILAGISERIAVIMVDYTLSQAEATEVVSIMGLPGNTHTAAQAVAVKGVLDTVRGNAALDSTLISGGITWEQRRGGTTPADQLANQVAWADQHLAIVANAQAIGTNLATVFLGDGLILEAVGGKDEATIKGEMTHIPTDRVHVAAINGATVEEIEFGINNGWLPTKTAYSVVHAGRAEVEANQTRLTTDIETDLSKNIGQNIGSIYTTLTIKTAEQGGNPTSVIFSGIIPSTSIHSSNVNMINGDDGIKKVVPTYDATNMFITPNSANNLNTTADGVFGSGYHSTTVTFVRRSNQEGAQG
jgi:hypothetical protein